MLKVLVGVVLPPIVVAVFVAGMAYRFYAWKKRPYPKMTLYPAPEKASFSSVVKATFFFPGLFRGDKSLWVMSWVFHVVLALILVGHIRVFTDFPALWAALGINADAMSATTGGAAGVIIMITLLLLIMRRFGVERVREISGPGDYFALLLVMAVILTGNAMRFFTHIELDLTRAYFTGLITLSAVKMPADVWFLAHFFFVQVLMMYIPFSKILHFGGVFFSQLAIQKR
jgi:nitrate reductase gamma subunit